MTTRNRQPAGRPTGGQFAPEARSSADVALDPHAGDYRNRFLPSDTPGMLTDERGHLVGLGEAVDWDSGFRVNPDGSVDVGVSSSTARDLERAAEDASADDFGEIPEAVRGHSGQHGYDGPLMHPSEQLAGGMAKAVLETPGTYVLTEARDHDDPDALIGWVLLRRES
ncbi:MAG TPA: hypothetical protein VK054_00005 [Beutenbergiaceae bacterium]|nr:hypothetical protein [Beutenbergiaceae bacterium]